MNGRRKQLMAEAVLVIVMCFWGATFTVVKEVIRTVPVHWFHTLRFSMAAAALWVLFALTPREQEGAVPRLDWRAVGAGALLGVALFLSYAFQTFGLVTTTASKSAFITSTAVLWVPFLMVVAVRVPIERKALLAGSAGLAGLFLLVMDRGWATFWSEGVVVGDVLTLFCAFAVAVHLLLTKRYSHRYDTTVLTAVQVTVVAVLSLLCSVIWQETRSFAYPLKTYVAIGFLALVATAFNFWALTRAQRYTTAQRTAVIFLFEPLFAAATAWLALREHFALHQWCGAALILGAMFILESRTSKNDSSEVPE
jgi:drug/metabolite transporter (DMT)-like permease